MVASPFEQNVCWVLFQHPEAPRESPWDRDYKRRRTDAGMCGSIHSDSSVLDRSHALDQAHEPNVVSSNSPSSADEAEILTAYLQTEDQTRLLPRMGGIALLIKGRAKELRIFRFTTNVVLVNVDSETDSWNYNETFVFKVSPNFIVDRRVHVLKPVEQVKHMSAFLQFQTSPTSFTILFSHVRFERLLFLVTLSV